MLTSIDDNYLDSLGIIKDAEYRQYIGEKLLSLLNMRMAIRVSEVLDDNEIQNLMSMNENRRMNWIEHNVSGFKQMIEEELSEIMRSLKAVLPS